METRRAKKKRPAKDQGILVHFAEAIGSKLGSVAAKADVFSKPVRRRAAPRTRSSKLNKKRKPRKA